MIYAGKMQRSTSDADLNQYNGIDGMVNNQDAKDDKKKRGRSPFRLDELIIFFFTNN